MNKLQAEMVSRQESSLFKNQNMKTQECSYGLNQDLKRHKTQAFYVPEKTIIGGVVGFGQSNSLESGN